MDQTGVVRQYEASPSAFVNSFGRAQAFDIHHHAVSKSLDGLCLVLGQEERGIRSDPGARITPLLQQVLENAEAPAATI